MSELSSSSFLHSFSSNHLDKEMGGIQMSVGDLHVCPSFPSMYLFIHMDLLFHQAYKSRETSTTAHIHLEMFQQQLICLEMPPKFMQIPEHSNILLSLLFYK